MQIVDRQKLLAGPHEPTAANLRAPEVGRFELSSMNGAHTALPVLGMQLPEFAKDKGASRDFVFVVNESLVNECIEPRQRVFVVDVTEEKTPVGVGHLQRAGEAGRLLQPRRALRLALVEREPAADVRQAQHLRPGSTPACARSTSATRSIRARSATTPGDHRQDRQALHQGRRRRGLQGRHPDQQRRRSTTRLHL
jgi:hypothetical protein